MSTLSTHVLDTARGAPAGGMEISLERFDGDRWRRVGAGVTGDDGRAAGLGGEVPVGVHRLTFNTEGYHAAQGVSGFYPEVQVCFEIMASDEHYHVPLLISPFGYSTYRGS